tara:strand:- start:1017 stop:2504 length:1488 start_codon:yes stop_codon:yes gene_type:complete
MSLNVFENTNLNFDVSLIKLDQRHVGGEIKDIVDSVLPIDTAAILKLDINESSLTMGAKGSVTISNKFNILEQLDITTNSPNDLYIAINIKDTELGSIDINDENKVVTVVGLINSTAAGSVNIVDNIIILSWEEAFVAATRKTQIDYFTSKGDIPNMDVIQLANRFNREIFKLKTDDIITVDAALPNVLHDLKTADRVRVERSNVSVYDAIQTMLKETTVGTAGRGHIGKVPYFRFVNAIGDDGTVKRKLKFDAFLTDRHIEFVNAVKVGVNTGDFSDVYTEKFSIGPLVETAANDPNINLYNKIETYNITRADMGRLREELWGDYVTFNSPLEGNSFNMDHSYINTDKKSFPDIISEFMERDLNGAEVDVNLPLLNPKEIQEFVVEINTLSDPERTANAALQQNNLIANTVIKSFITINETITFTVKGSVVRQPNKFIWIERGADEEDYKKLWYVNSVTHKFEEGKYTTDVIATKIFGNTTAAAIEASKVIATS